MRLPPQDEFNQQLLANVRPADWQNPRPDGRYNLIVIGGGTAGLVSAAFAAGAGAKVALIERHLMGGDCLNFGCVPSKALIRSARAAHAVRRSTEFGVHALETVAIEFPKVMERMRRLRARISPNDSVKRFTEMGIDVYLGEANFTGPTMIEVEGRNLEFARAIIATGARAASIPVPGLEETGYLTNETVFSLTNLPQRLAVIGGGPIGCELAQTFRRLGSKVHVLDISPRLMPRDDVDASTIIQARFQEEGIELHLGVAIQQVQKSGDSKLISYSRNDNQAEIEIDEILLAVGRRPNVEGLNLDAAQVRFDKNSVEVDDRLQTSNSAVYAAGDICSRYKFTHAADALARIAVQNALFFGRKRASSLVIPWCTYTDPEVAHVGLLPDEAAEQGIGIETFTVELTDIDRALLDGEEDGFVRVHVYKGTDRIAGGTIVAAHAGEMLGEITLAMNRKIGLGSLSSVIHTYPTQAEAIKRLGDQFQRTRLTPFVAGLLKKVMAWRR